MFKKVAFPIIVWIFILSLNNSATASVYIEHPLDHTLSGGFSNNTGQVIVDNFYLSSKSLVNKIVWYGNYLSDPISLSSISFDINIYSNIGNKPSSYPTMHIQSISPIITDTGYESINGHTIYKFEATLPSPFTGNSGETIWISIVNNHNSSGTQWIWSKFSMDGFSASRVPDSTQNTDWSMVNYGRFAFGFYYEPIIIQFVDIDGDGYGDPYEPYETNEQLDFLVTDATDCNDSDSSIHPGAAEIRGDGIDQDCNGSDLQKLYSDVEEFVTRFYQQCLSREPDTGGLNNWVNNLNNGDKTGDKLAEAFIFSEEFKNRNTSNSDFVTILYKAFFNREPDIGGYNNWINSLSGGTSRSSVLDGFTSAEEFKNLCQNYGISANASSSTDSSVAGFVTRFYQQCLSREPDTGGLNNWVNNLNNGDKTGDKLAEAFIFSEEFKNRNTSNSDFVTILYKAFFNREPDIGGYNNWINSLSGGTSRSSVLDGFTSAEEFITLCGNYGITAASPDDNPPNDQTESQLSLGIVAEDRESDSLWIFKNEDDEKLFLMAKNGINSDDFKFVAGGYISASGDSIMILLGDNNLPAAIIGDGWYVSVSNYRTTYIDGVEKYVVDLLIETADDEFFAYTGMELDLLTNSNTNQAQLMSFSEDEYLKRVKYALDGFLNFKTAFDNAKKIIEGIRKIKNIKNLISNPSKLLIDNAKMLADEVIEKNGSELLNIFVDAANQLITLGSCAAGSLLSCAEFTVSVVSDIIDIYGQARQLFSEEGPGSDNFQNIKTTEQISQIMEPEMPEGLIGDECLYDDMYLLTSVKASGGCPKKDLYVAVVATSAVYQLMCPNPGAAIIEVFINGNLVKRKEEILQGIEEVGYAYGIHIKYIVKNPDYVNSDADSFEPLAIGDVVEIYTNIPSAYISGFISFSTYDVIECGDFFSYRPWDCDYGEVTEEAPPQVVEEEPSKPVKEKTLYQYKRCEEGDSPCIHIDLANPYNDELWPYVPLYCHYPVDDYQLEQMRFQKGTECNP